MRVIVSEFMDESALETVGAGVSVHYDPGLVDDRAGLVALLADADAIIVRNRTKVDAALLASAPKLKVVGRLGVGLDNIDQKACARRDIAVRPALGSNTISVAEYVITAAAVLARGAFSSNERMIAGHWPRDQLGRGGELNDRKMGLLGFGAIAQAVAARAKLLGMTVAAFDPYLPSSHPAWREVERPTRDELLTTSDVLSIHVPLSDETRNMINAAAISAMKPSAILVNTSRGGIVDETALVAALKSGDLGGAALDVFEKEPLTAEAGALFANTPNLILTPHIAGVTGESNVRVSAVTVKNVMEELGCA